MFFISILLSSLTNRGSGCEWIYMRGERFSPGMFVLVSGLIDIIFNPRNRIR